MYKRQGLIHIGDERTPAGRYDEKPCTGLSEQLAKYNFKIGRLKTGTPPRLDSRTIKFENLEEQFADDDPYFFLSLKLGIAPLGLQNHILLRIQALKF